MIPKPSSVAGKCPVRPLRGLEAVRQDLQSGIWVRIAARVVGTEAVWAAELLNFDGKVSRRMSGHYVGGSTATSPHSWVLDLLTGLDLPGHCLPTPIRLLFHFSCRPPSWLIGLLNQVENLIVLAGTCRPWEFTRILEQVGSMASSTFAPAVAYTDASVRRGGLVLGLGALIVKDGQIVRWKSETYSPGLRRVGVVVGELRAIKLAVDVWLEDKMKGGSLGARRLIIRTDSKHALEQIARETNPDESVNGRGPWSLKRQLASEIASSTRGLDVDFQWVKAHSGEPLNDCADRLAVAARRAAEAGLESRTAREIQDRIVTDAASMIAA